MLLPQAPQNIFRCPPNHKCDAGRASPNLLETVLFTPVKVNPEVPLRFACHAGILIRCATAIAQTMSLSCPQCASQMPDTAAFCPGCGHPMHPEARARGTVGVLSEGVAGALAYVSLIPAVVFLLLDPYNKNRFVRFHSFQCIFLWVTGLLIAVVLRFVGLILYIIPVLGHLLVWLIAMVVILGAVVIWLVLMVKALQGEAFKLPVIGDLAERQAGSF